MRYQKQRSKAESPLADMVPVAKVTEGGFSVSGRWNYLSGVDHAKWLFLNCALIDDNGPVIAADGNQKTRVVVVPSGATSTTASPQTGSS